MRDSEDIPKQVRVRTDPEQGLGYRYDTIEEAAKRFECNKTDAIVAACDVAGPVLDGIRKALDHPDLPPALAAELAETMSSRYVTVEYEKPDVTVEVE